MIASDGRDVWVRDHAELVSDAEGRRWLGVMVDITRQKEAEELLLLAKDELEMRVLTRTAELAEANEMMSLEIGERRRIEQQLREAELRYRLLVEDLPAAVYSWEMNWEDDPDPLPVEPYTSPQFEAILGFPPSEWNSPGFWMERIHPHDRERIVALGEHCARPASRSAPSTATSQRTGVGMGPRPGNAADPQRPRQARLFQGVMLDITDRKRAEEQALAAEERFRTLAEQGPFVVYQYELEHADPPAIHMSYLSPAAGDLLDVSSSVWAGDLGAWLELVHPDDVDEVTAIADEAFRTGNPWNHVFRMIAGDGRIVWVLDRGQAIERDDRGRPHVFQGVLLDVTQEAEIHAELEASRRRCGRSSRRCLPSPGPRSSTPRPGTDATASSDPRWRRSSDTPGELLSSPTTSSDSCTRTIASGRWRRATGATAPASRGISSTG